MRLFTYHRAPNPRRVRWFMAEKDLGDIEIVDVDIIAGEHKTPDYRGRAGLPHVPALELNDGSTITESLAICRYLEALHPEPNLFGHGPEEAAQIEMWTRRCEIYLANPMMLHVRHTHPALSALEAPNPAVGEYNKLGAERFLGALDRQLAHGKGYIAAGRMSMADIVAAVGLDFARLVKYAPPSDLIHVDRWMGAMRERPGFAAGA